MWSVVQNNVSLFWLIAFHKFCSQYLYIFLLFPLSRIRNSILMCILEKNISLAVWRWHLHSFLSSCQYRKDRFYTQLKNYTYIHNNIYNYFITREFELIYTVVIVIYRIHFSIKLLEVQCQSSLWLFHINRRCLFLLSVFFLSLFLVPKKLVLRLYWNLWRKTMTSRKTSRCNECSHLVVVNSSQPTDKERTSADGLYARLIHKDSYWKA